MTRRGLATAALAALVACLAGCGGGGDGDGASTQPTTHPANAPLAKAEYIERADDICQVALERIQSAGSKLRAASERTGKPPPADQVARFMAGTSLPIYDDMLDELRVLPPPVRDAPAIEAFIAALEGAIDMVRAAPAKYAGEEAEDPFDAPTSRAKKYGMAICGF